MASPNGGTQRYGCYIGNIDSTVTVDMLKQVFCSCGTILDASLNGRTEDPYRFGFIDFATEEARAKALKYNGFTLIGRKLRVNVSKGNVGKPEGFGNPTPRENRPPRQDGYGYRQPQEASAPPTNGSGLTPAEQQQAQFLLQLIQQGSVDPQTLTEAQRTLLVAALSGGSTGGDASQGASGNSGNNGSAPAPAPAPAPMAPVVTPPPMGATPQMAPPMGMYNPMWGGYPGMGPYGTPMMNPAMMMGMYGGPQHMGMHGGGGGGGRHHRGTPANPQPPEELLKLREIQRKQFLKVVREETEAYEKKRKEREGKEGAKSANDSSDSEGDDADGGHHQNTEAPEEKKVRMEISDADEPSE